MRDLYRRIRHGVERACVHCGGGGLHAPPPGPGRRLTDLYKPEVVGTPEWELHDHRRDPLDLRDVAASHPEVVERLRRELEAWRRAAVASRLKPTRTPPGR